MLGTLSIAHIAGCPLQVIKRFFHIEVSWFLIILHLLLVVLKQAVFISSNSLWSWQWEINNISANYNNDVAANGDDNHDDGDVLQVSWEGERGWDSVERLDTVWSTFCRRLLQPGLPLRWAGESKGSSFSHTETPVTHSPFVLQACLTSSPLCKSLIVLSLTAEGFSLQF